MRIPCVRQVDERDCGAAALATVCKHYRRPIALQKLRDLAGTDRAGTTLRGLADAAHRLGFSARGVRATAEHLPMLPTPTIACVERAEGPHFVVLFGSRPKHFVVSDPAHGARRIPRDEFLASWTGLILLISPAEHEAEETASPRGPWSRFFSLLRPHVGVLVEALVCAVILAVLGLSTSLFIQHLVDSVLVHGQWRFLDALAGGMLALVLFRCALSAIRGYFLAHVSRNVDLMLIARYARHVVRLPLRFFETRRTGEVLARVRDALSVRDAISGTTLTVVVDTALVIISGAVMFWYDTGLALIACATMPFYMISVFAHQPLARRFSRAGMENFANLQAHLTEDLTAIETIKACGAESQRSEASDRSVVRTANSLFSMQMLELSMSTIGLFLTAASGIVLLWIGGHRVIEGALTVGQLMFFYSLLSQMLEPIGRLASVNMQVQETVVALERLGDVLDLEIEKLDDERKVRIDEVSEGVRLEEVEFGYASRAKVLRGIDLDIAAGTTVGIVGQSGSGKSTLLKLLQRFHEPTSGRITVDGVDLRDIELSSLRGAIGVVPQEAQIFAGTVEANIAFGRPESTREEIVAAARAAGIHEFIESLPERYDSLLGERGANLSGGQRQRIAIARALVGDPPIIVLDEATSQLDTRTEEELRDHLEHALEGRTVIIVAHRLSTIRHADRICVLDAGRVAEEGDHDDLLARDGLYAALWDAQNGGALRRATRRCA